MLLNEGIELKKSLIPRLKNWDIAFVSIQSDEDESAEEAQAVSSEFKAQHLEELFKDVLGDPLMKIVYDATLNHFSKK